MKKTRKKGFTIVELVIVIAVIAILAAVLIPTFSGVIENAKKSAALSDAKNAMTADLILAEGDYGNMSKLSDGQLKGTYTAATGEGQSAKPATWSYRNDDYTCTFTISTGEWTTVENS